MGLRHDKPDLRGACARGQDAGFLRGVVGTSGRGVTGAFPGEFSRFVEGRVGLAGGRSGSVKKLFVFIIRKLLGLRCGPPGLRGHPARTARMPGACGASEGGLPGEVFHIVLKTCGIGRGPFRVR